MSGNFYKEYYVTTQFKTTGSELRSICKSYDMDAVCLDTEAEQKTFLEFVEIKRSMMYQYMTLVGGYTLTPKNRTGWYWMNSGSLVNYPLRFSQSQPDFAYDREYCLSIWFTTPVSFNDVGCGKEETLRFTCQKISERKKTSK